MRNIKRIVFYEYTEAPDDLLFSLFGFYPTDQELVELLFGDDNTLFDGEGTAYFLAVIDSTLYVIASDWLSPYEQKQLYTWWLSNAKI